MRKSLATLLFTLSLLLTSSAVQAAEYGSPPNTYTFTVQQVAPWQTASGVTGPYAFRTIPLVTVTADGSLTGSVLASVRNVTLTTVEFSVINTNYQTQDIIVTLWFWRGLPVRVYQERK